MPKFGRKLACSKSLFWLTGLLHALLIAFACVGSLFWWSRHQGRINALHEREASIQLVQDQSRRLLLAGDLLESDRTDSSLARFNDAMKGWKETSSSVLNALGDEHLTQKEDLAHIQRAQSSLSSAFAAMRTSGAGRSVGARAAEVQAAYSDALAPTLQSIHAAAESKLPLWLWGFAVLALLLMDAFVLFQPTLKQARLKLENELYDRIFERERLHRDKVKQADEAANRAIQEKQALLETHAAALEVALQRAEEASQLKSSFLANMSHEIRTPMNGVIGTAQILAQSQLTAEQYEWVRMMIGSGDQLVRIINDILDLSQVEAGKLGLEPRPVDPRELITDAVRPFEAETKAKGVPISVYVAADAAQLVVLDPERVRQIVSNLLSNATRFTSTGRIDVAVSTSKGEGQSGELLIGVQDSGIGIPADRLDAIFESFGQADVSTKRVYGGTGLGLTIVKQLAELMGGTVNVKSTPKVGSEFTVRIPIQIVEKQLESPSHLGGFDLAAPNLGLKCLVVEDNPVNQMVAARLLEKLGCTAEIASDGQIAVQKTVSSHYDVILMDIHMPNMDGIEATTAIRKREKEWSRPRTPIIAVTADAMEVDRRSFREAGMDEYVPKPVRQAELLMALSSFMKAKVA